MQPRQKTHRIFSTREQCSEKQCGAKLNSIINTFRENNMRLMHQIQQCDKSREMHTHTNRKMVSEKILLGKYGHEQIKTFQSSPCNHRSMDKLRRSSKRTKLLQSNPKKQNLVIQQAVQKFMSHTRTEHKQPINPSQSQIRVVKMSLDRLIPLSIDRLRERIKML